MADPLIEKILEVRTDKTGNLSYLVKWEGYPDSDNTWETREDLLADGFTEELKHADERLIGKPEYSMRNARRSRSKTPVRQPQQRKEMLISDSEDDDAEEAEDNTGVGLEDLDDSVNVEEENPTNYASVNLPDTFALIWLTTFVVIIAFTIAFEMWITFMEGNKSGPRVGWSLYAARLSACFPALMFMLLVYYKAPNTDFANRVCAIQLWISTLTFFELVPKLLPKDETSAVNDLVFFSLGMWQLLVFLSLSSSAAKHSEYGFNSVTALLVVIGAIGVGLAQNNENLMAYHLSVPQWLVLSIAVVSTLQAILLLYGLSERSFGTWLEFYGSFLSLMIVLLYILREVEHVVVPVQVIDIGQKRSLTINVMWFLETLMRWATCASFSYRAISYQQAV